MRLEGFNKKTGLFIIIYHSLLAIACAIYFTFCIPSLALIVSSFALFFITTLSVTAGYHRYFSHCTYKSTPLVETVLLFFSSAASQASALRWSFEHRLHHAFVDTDRDPYSVKKGFWHAHILWLFKKPAPIDTKVVSDLVKNPRVQFQHKYYLTCMLGSNIILFLLMGWLLNDFVGAFILGWWGRLFVSHHSTWCINSLAHMWGSRYFSKEQSAVDNYIISLITCGEGYHNYHHAFATDYRNGIRWYHFDPTKWLIWTLSKLGLASNLKRMDQLHVKERMVTESKRELMEAIQEYVSNSFSTKKEELNAYATRISDELSQKLTRLKAVAEEYRAQQSAKAHAGVENLKREIRFLNKSIQEDLKHCRQVTHALVKGKEHQVAAVIPA